MSHSFCPFCGHKLNTNPGTYMYTKYVDPNLQKKQEIYFTRIIKQEAKHKYQLYFVMTIVIFIIILLMTVMGVWYVLIHLS